MPTLLHSQAACRAIPALRAAAIFVAASCSVTAAGNCQTDSLPAQRRQFDQRLAAELGELARLSRERGLPAADSIEALPLQRDPRRTYIFLPQGKPLIDKDQWGQEASLLARWEDILARGAAELRAMADEAIAAQRGDLAYQCLQELLCLAPDQADVRVALGYDRAGRWEPPRRQPTVGRARRRHELVNWSQRDYQLVDTPNFAIATNADPQQVAAVAEQFERWLAVWQQVCFDYWSDPQSLARALENARPLRTPRKRQGKFDVVIFADVNDYRAALAEIDGIELSTGFYLPEKHASFFFLQEGAASTWRHELVHQFFQETASADLAPGEDHWFWAIEGVAMYFESIVEYPHHVTLGGWDARRMQYARTRLRREHFFVPFADLAVMGRGAVQSHPDVAKLYTQSAGLAHFMMDGRDGAYRPAMIAALQALYTGRGQADGLLSSFGDDASIDQQYAAFLQVSADDVNQFFSEPGSRTELALTDCQLDGAVITAIAACKNLQWIDLSGNRFDDPALQQLGELPNLQALFLNGNPLTDACLETIARYGSLQSLELSGTRITDQGLTRLAGLRRLQELVVDGTGVTPQGLQQLKQQLPNLK